MGGTLDCSVIIPTRDRSEKLAACLDRLSRQSIGTDRFETLVGLDGRDPESARVGRGAAGPVRLFECERVGIAGVKNRLLEEARGEFIVLLNDDVLPADDFLETHVRAQRERGGNAAMILGFSPWLKRSPDRLFDRLIRETSMIFFYDRMDDADPERDWGFRHAWNLNLSLPLAAARDGGGFYHDPAHKCGYEDIEFAWRVQTRLGLPVLYRPAARADHDHPYEPEGYLAREHELGRQAWGLAHASPECARAIFGRDIRDQTELAYAREFLERESKDVRAVQQGFLSLAKIPADAIAGEHAKALLQLLHQQHLLLKRYCWREGLLGAAAEGEAAEPTPKPLGAVACAGRADTPDAPAPLPMRRGDGGAHEERCCA